MSDYTEKNSNLIPQIDIPCFAWNSQAEQGFLFFKAKSLGDEIVPIIMTSHGSLASSMMETAGLIIEMRDEVYCLELKEEESLEDFKCRLGKLIQCVKGDSDKVIIVSDMPLATPFNAATMLMQKYNIYHLTGMSMQMLTFLLQKDNSYMEEENLCREALAKAKEQTLYLNDVLKGEKKN